jgi:hypothetical protein
MDTAYFAKNCQLDFSGLKIGGLLDISHARWPESRKENKIHGMEFRDVIPTKAETFLELLNMSELDPDAYNSVERFLRGSGHSDDAKEIGMARVQRQRKAEFSFLGIGSWLGSWFLYILVGNGYAPERSLYWALAIIVVGSFVFRENRMLYLREKPAGDASGLRKNTPYSSFLYSLDLFVPAVNLGVANLWEPKPERTGLFHWMYIQKTLGWILVPIGILAFSGFIKV